MLGICYVTSSVLDLIHRMKKKVKGFSVATHSPIGDSKNSGYSEKMELVGGTLKGKQLLTVIHSLV